MLEVKILTAQIELNPTDLHSVLSLLSQEGWKPLLFDADANFAKLAGLHENMDFFEFRQSLHLHLENFPFIVGDIFFRDTNEVYYLAAITDNVIPPPDLDDYGLFFDNDFDKTPIVEVGVLSSSPDDLSERLKAFADSVMEAIGTISNRSTENGGKFEWQESTLITSQLDRIKFVLDTESHTRFKGARLVPSEVQAACVLATRLNREILIELNKARFVLRKDVLSKRYKNQIQIHKALEELVASGLIITEREGYSVTDLGKLMASGSHWMTVWVTDLLMKLGIPEQAILWNIFEHGEEVDLLVEFLEQLWILELKDKEFGSGNAYSLNYRQVRYRA
ncbi:MAG TPA: hypothetical protein ENO10_03785, partial [Salinimicrobium catena]|nr:hypothetical protein [Salinimicrobium catena]